MLKHVCIKYKADIFATMVISIPWKNGVFSMFVYCGIACTYCTIRKYTSKDVELHLEECLLQNYVFPFSRLFPLHPQVFVLQNSVSNMLCGKCGFFGLVFFPLFGFYFFWQISGAFPFGLCQIILITWAKWGALASGILLFQRCSSVSAGRSEWSIRPGLWLGAVYSICHKTFNINLLKYSVI